MKLGILFFTVFIFYIYSVSAHGEDSSIENGKLLVDSKIGCDKLTEEQLESIGDYYMGQMHPGAAHETMDNAMGGEGSDQLKQMHVRMAKMMHCGEGNMLNMMGSGMVNGGVMNMMQSNMMGYGMMQGSTTLIWFWSLLTFLLLLGLTVLIWVLVVKYWKEVSHKK